MAKKENTAVAVQDEITLSPPAVAPIDSPVPDFMKSDMGKPIAGFTKDDYQTPFLKLMQGLSPELQTFNELRPGDFFHTSAGRKVASPFRAVPVYVDKRFILWNPRDSGGGILARADDGVHWQPANASFTVKLDKKDGGDTVVWKTAETVQQSGLNNWGTMNPKDSQSPPAATLMYSYLLAFPDEPDLVPAVLTFQRSSIKIGRNFNTALITHRIPMYGLVYEITSVSDKNKRGQDFFNVGFRGAGRINDENMYKVYRDLNEQMSSTGLRTEDLERVQDEEIPADTGGDAPANAPGF